MHKTTLPRSNLPFTDHSKINISDTALSRQSPLLYFRHTLSCTPRSAHTARPVCVSTYACPHPHAHRRMVYGCTCRAPCALPCHHAANASGAFFGVKAPPPKKPPPKVPERSLPERSICLISATSLIKDAKALPSIRTIPFGSDAAAPACEVPPKEEWPEDPGSGELRPVDSLTMFPKAESMAA